MCDWGLGLAVFWREVTVFLNAKHLKYLRPLSLFRFKGMARSSGLVAAARVLRSCLLTARQTGSNAIALDLII